MRAVSIDFDDRRVTWWLQQRAYQAELIAHLRREGMTKTADLLEQVESSLKRSGPCLQGKHRARIAAVQVEQSLNDLPRSGFTRRVGRHEFVDVEETGRDRSHELLGLAALVTGHEISPSVPGEVLVTPPSLDRTVGETGDTVGPSAAVSPNPGTAGTP